MASEEAPADVFGLLADDIRVQILAAIARAQHEQTLGNNPVSLSFSEIYDQLDVDNTSKFSYHLGELVGTFITETPDGYRFTHAGDRIVRMVLAGNYEQPPDFGSIEIGDACPYCDEGDLEARIREQFFTVVCSDCGANILAYAVTPSQVRSNEREELLESIGTKFAADYRQVMQGICPACTGRLDAEIHTQDEVNIPDPYSFLVRDECEHCLRGYNMPLPFRATYHPASVAFHWEQGTDITRMPMWAIHENVVAERWTAERTETDPVEYRIVHRSDPQELHVHLDSNATVTRTERVRGRTIE